MPERESRTKGDVVPCASPGLPEFTALLFPETFLQEEVTIVLFDIQKIRVVTQEEERGRVPSNDMGTEVYSRE